MRTKPNSPRGELGFVHFPTLASCVFVKLMHSIHFCRTCKKIRNLHRCPDSLTLPNLWGNSGVTASMKVSRFRLPINAAAVAAGGVLKQIGHWRVNARLATKSFGSSLRSCTRAMGAQGVQTEHRQGSHSQADRYLQRECISHVGGIPGSCGGGASRSFGSGRAGRTDARATARASTSRACAAR